MSETVFPDYTDQALLPPTTEHLIGWWSTAPRCATASTSPAPACTPRTGCSIGLDYRAPRRPPPPKSSPPPAPAPRCTTAWSGTCVSPPTTTKGSWPSTRPPLSAYGRRVNLRPTGQSKSNSAALIGPLTSRHPTLCLLAGTPRKARVQAQLSIAAGATWWW